MVENKVEGQITESVEYNASDLEYLNQFLASTCYTLLNLNKDLFYRELHDTENQKILRTFAGDKNSRSLLIAKVEKSKIGIGSGGGAEAQIKDDDKDGQSLVEGKSEMDNKSEILSQFTEEEDPKSQKDIELRFSLKVVYLGQTAHTIAFLKREAFTVLDFRYSEGARHLSSQLQTLNLGYIGEDSNIFELAATYVEYSFLPLFNSYKTSSATTDEKGKSTSGLQSVQQSLSQLKVHLVQCQQNLDIPEIELMIDSDIKAKMEECRAKGRDATEEDFDSRLKDNEFLKRLQKCVDHWYRDIRKVTQLKHDPTSGSALQEINFWLSLERSLNHIKEQLSKKEVQLTLNLLQQGQRMKTVFTFLHDTELEPTLKTAQNYNKILRDFPINQLLSANDLDQIAKSIEMIFVQLKKIRHTDSYPIQKAILLMEALSQDLTNQLLKVLSNFQIMYLDYKDFKVIQKSIRNVFEVWLENLRSFKELIRTQVSNRNDRSGIQGFMNLEKNPIKERLDNIITFRYHHYKLKQVISRTLSKENTSDNKNFEEQALNDINDAYNLFLNINVLDISKAGIEVWEATKKTYDLKIDKVESQITASLRDKLSSAANANEMFKVFSIFNALFTRPRIRGAIQEYQNQLLTQVKKDINGLKEKLINEAGVDSNLNLVRDFPTISNKITWTKQIERKLNVYMERVQKVLGENWEQHLEGRELRNLGDLFQQKLTSIQQHYYDQWLQEISQINVQQEKEKHIFEIEQRVDKYEMVLNYNQKLFHLFKEQVNLKRLGFKPTLSVTLRAQEVQNMYPMAMSLQESLRTFQYTNSKVTDKFNKLVAQVKNDAQQCLIEGMSLNWKNESRVEQYSMKLSQRVMAFEEAVNEVMEKTSVIEEFLNELGQCEVQREALANRLKSIQKIVDEFNFQEFSNLNSWVEELDQRIQGILTKRLEEVVQAWVMEFSKFQELGGNIIKVKTVLEIKIQNQAIILDPPIAEARTFWYKQFHNQIGIICGLPKVESSRYEKFKEKDSTKDKTYKGLLLRMNQKDLNAAYEALESQLKGAEAYVKTWKSYQALWDIEASHVFNILGDNIDKWHQLLNEIRQGRKTFDTSDVESLFGAIVVYYGGVQAKVNNKYDQWHKDILNKFGTTLGENMKTFNSTIQKARRQLEALSIDASDDVTLFVTEIQEMKRQLNVWQTEMDKYKSGQKLLHTQRYQFPIDWLWIDVIDGEWSAFKQILQKKSKVMEDQIPTLQAKILEEERQVGDKIKEIEEEWKVNKPYQGTIAPSRALDLLSIIGKKIQGSKNEWVRICKAKELLDMELGNPRRLDDLEEDLQGLRAVWTEVNKVWSIVEAVNETPFSAYVHKKVKEQLDAAIEEMTNFPNRLRQYQVYDEYKALIQKYRKVNTTLSELKSDAMKPRHWKDLLSQLRLKTSFNDLSLDHLWQADLMKHDKQVKDILNQARGELILEDFLRTIKETWAKYELDLIKYQNKGRLIRGWDELFQQIDEHINNLQSMKMSPYYKVFEEEIVPWDDKMNKMRIIFDTWIDVQRRYVYLEGIFFGSAEIKSMLSAEFNRFKGIDNEFTALMKKVAQKPVVLEVLSIQGLQKTLERFADMLNKIQKALVDYLETQRQNFARFYFVGDEDLLEIIGNSKEIKMVQRHFPKMFAGITQVEHENEGDHLTGMFSREGEYVAFSNKVIISEEPRIDVWLTKIEAAMQISLAHQLEQAVVSLELLDKNEQQDEFNEWIQRFPAQIAILSMQVSWSGRVEESLEQKKGASLPLIEDSIRLTLEMLAERVLTDLKKDVRQKYEQLITDLVHQREVTKQLINERVASISEFVWLYHMRFYWRPKEKEALEKLSIQMANSNFFYGFEYLGVGERLVQTPLTDRCYLTLTQALHWRLGGSPFGPAGTGKTESVKALGCQLGRFVLVFNCDETFDGNAMGRIFVGLCQVGAWGCFDEFNRLEERMLSAVSQSILLIQLGLKDHLARIDLMGRDVKLNSAMGIFITMNPGYAGRSNLPDNLKQLFRQMAMVKPDKEMIARVMLYSQGFKTAERLSGKIVSLFDLCSNQLSSQSHYDFGLRALKSVLVSAGNLKRVEKAKIKDLSQITVEWETNILLKSLCDTLVPKLIAEDVPLLQSLLTGVFPGSSIIQIKEERLIDQIERLSSKYNLICKDQFIEKVLQLYQIANLHHGLMMVGPTGCGKSAAWKILLEALERLDGIKGESYVIDPKAINKDDLYGRLDSTTAEWTDGVFTQVLRRIIDNVRGESAKRHWIIFDGDVDPEWAENLNSVLDDNKLLTLPSGERLAIPPNVRLMFEVETLKHATLATVSRCGMVWFSEETVTLGMIYHHYLSRLMQDSYDSLGEDSKSGDGSSAKDGKSSSAAEHEAQALLQQLSADVIQARAVRRQCVNSIRPLFEEDAYMTKVLDHASSLPHVMEFTRIRCLESTFALIRKGITNVIDYNDTHPDFHLSDTQIEAYMTKWVVFATIWGVGGSMNLLTRTNFSNKLNEFTSVAMPNISNSPLIDYEVRLDDQQWHLWKKKVPQIEIEPSKVIEADVVITTVDTTRHQEVLCSWISEHRPFLLCGPPGSGKTMTLMATLKNLTDFEMIFINFSSSTLPDLILKTFDHYCEYKKTPSGMILRPHQLNKWLVVFCDEINLPETDKYGTQVVITFLRQITEQNGFWRSQDKQWVKLERIQFVGACNPPTDAGRHPLSERFLRHCPLIFVDFPGPESLKQIYGTFNRAMLKKVPVLKQCADPLTEAMVEFYNTSQQHFTSDMQPHYIYSPRELTRWKYAIYEALNPLETPEDLVRLFVHEGLRLFEDRLVYQEEKEWCNKTIDEVAQRWFPSVDHQRALERPILFTNYLKKDYVSVRQEELKKFIEARLTTFYEEELNVPLVVFDSVLDHILRIDRVLRQPLGHLLLVGASGVGKTTLSRFVSWMNNLTVFQIKAGRNYSVQDFDDDLRTVMKRAGCKMEKICFIFDESNVLSAAFLERMNALLASGEIPGLFEGEEYMALINSCKEAALKDGKIIDTEEELYKRFTYNVQRNLHVVFTMNPQNPDFSNRTASSPALFNRCVIDWFGEWSNDGLLQVAKEFTKNLDILPESFMRQMEIQQRTLDDGKVDHVDPKHEALCQIIVEIHTAVRDINTKLSRSAKKFNYITPRDFLDFIKHFVELQHEKKEELQEQQYHLNVGLEKLQQTESAVIDLQGQLVIYEKDLFAKQSEANSKLKLMVKEQQEAEQKRVLSIKTAKELEVKSEEITRRQVEVQRDLGKAEPALIAAQESVSGISKDNLNELRALASPPAMVKLALEPVVAMITNAAKKPEWAEIRVQLRKDTFISSILNFDKDAMAPAVKKFIQTNYLQKKEEFVVEKIFKASKAVGPLALWVQSIVEYADIYERIQPLRNEVAELTEEENRMKQEMVRLEQLVKELEINIAQYQVDYAALIAAVENIKNEMQKVTEKANRSKSLVQNLSSERVRWEESSRNFREQMSCLLGDVLLSSAFLTYVGFFDHFYRQFLQGEWRFFSDSVSLKYRSDISYVEFLSKPTDRLLWQVQELPNDELCIQNAIILKRFNRYPLVIDPSDQALKFISNHYADKKIQKTSFADDSFMKNLETAIRFGLPLLVQDVERIDPVLNSVLNKEVHKQGGRVLIRVGDQEIDFSQTFVLFMITRNPSAVFTPDLCSRVTFINFTVTPSSLQNQCVNIFLKNEREQIDKKRNDLLKLQGECKVKLRELEDSLLDALNKSEGNILDNNALINTLETLKREAADIASEVEKSDDTMKEIEVVSNEYLPLANMASRIYFTLDSMSAISFLYQYSLQHFMEYIFAVLNTNEELSKVPKSQPEQRLKIIMREFFMYVYEKISQGLMLSHQVLFALRLAQIRMGGDASFDVVFDLLMKSPAFLETKLPGSLMNGMLSKTQLKYLEELNSTKQFQDIVQHIEADEDRWVEFMGHPSAELHVPDISSPDGSETEIIKEMKRMILVKILRPDRFITAARALVSRLLGQELLNSGEVDLLKVVDKESIAKSPLLLVSAPGFDASYKVDMLAKQSNKKYTSVAIGSPEAFDLVDKAIKAAAKTGSWVLLKNVHLAPQWLTELEKTIYKLQLNPNFRLFMTMEFNPKVPSTLLRASHVFVFEPPSGIKASLLRSYTSTITAVHSDKVPVERSKLHFLVAWFNAVVQERLRYTPIGWSKFYEFNESDQRCAVECVDEWLDSMGKDRSNVDPDRIPWDALRTLIGQSVFGGKIDNEYDGKILASLVNQFFRKESFNLDYPLFTVPAGSGEVLLKVPDVKNYKGFLQWIKELPQTESPSWSGLPLNVEKLVRERQAASLIASLKLIQGTGDDLIPGQADGKADKDSKAAWLVLLQEKVEKLLQTLPSQLQVLIRTSASITNPLFRFLEREVTVASDLLETVRRDLVAIKEMCSGERKSTNILKSLAEDLHADVIPKKWRKYNVANISGTEWVNDFKKRIDQLQRLSQSSDFGKKGLWFGGLLFPEAYLTATRQSVAQENKWSLEELELKFEVDPSEEYLLANSQGFVVSGLSVEGAEFSKSEDRIKLSDSLSSHLPRCNLKWVNKNLGNTAKDSKDDTEAEQVQIPVYLSRQRSHLLFSVKVPTNGIPIEVWYQRGVSLFAWNKD